MTADTRFLALVAQHEAALWDIARNGGTPERYATIEAIEAEIDALAEAAEIAHYGTKAHCPSCGESVTAGLQEDEEGTFTECVTCGTFDVA